MGTPCGTSSSVPRRSPAVRSRGPISTRGTAATMRRVFISGQKRSIFGVIKRELRRRSVIEPIIGHMKAEGHPRPLLPQRAAPATPPMSSSQPSATTSSRILARLRELLGLFLELLMANARLSNTAQSGFLTQELEPGGQSAVHSATGSGCEEDRCRTTSGTLSSRLTSLVSSHLRAPRSVPAKRYPG
ncbi:hypothetical protein ACVIIV_003416 [Bradyrhizobium sp. USDA 4354]